MAAGVTGSTGDAGRGAILARRLSRSGLLRLSPLLALLALLLIWPLAMLVIGSFRTRPPGFPGDWTLKVWRGAFTEPGTLEAMRNSVEISLVTTTLSTVIAAGLAFLSERTDAPLRRWIAPGLFLLFATPGLLYAMGYALLGNPYTGLLNLPFRVLFGIRHGPIDIETWTGLLTVMTLKKVSVIYLFLIGPFRALDPVHDEASLLAGASAWKTFLRIDLPILAPALTGAVLLGVVTGLQAFDMVLVLGWPFDLQVLTTRIFDLVNISATPDYARASALSLSLLLVIALLSAVQWRILGSRSFVTVGGKSRGTRRIRLRRSRWLFGGLIALYLIAGVALPIGSVVFTSFQRFPGVYSGFSLENYAEVLVIPRLLNSLWVSFSLALVVGLAGMALAVIVVQAGRSTSPALAALLRFATLVPLAMPGVVTALAVAWASLALPGFKLLYGTAGLVGIAMAVCTVPFATQAANAAISQVAPELQEAARVSGATVLQSLGDILLRLIAPSFLVGWFMVAILITGNLEVPLLLEAPGQDPIASVIYDLFNRGEFSDACALLVVTLLAEAAIGLAGYGLLHGAGRFLKHVPAPRLPSLRPRRGLTLEPAE